MSNSDLEANSAAIAVSPSQPTAGLMRRLAALLYDGFLVAAIWMLIAFVMQLIVGTETNQLVDGQVETDPVLDTILFTLMVISCAGFYILFWTQSGQTTGMIAWRIKAVQENGQPLTFMQGVIRFLAAWPSMFILGLGFLCLLWNREAGTFPDRVSATKVVVVPKAQRPL